MTGTWSVSNGRLVAVDGIVEDGLVIVHDGKIAYAGSREGAGRAGFASDAPGAQQNPNFIDAGGGYICPGFIDIHVHGGGGSDVMDGTREALDTIARSHARFGTTGLLATTMTAPFAQLEDVVRVVGAAAAEPFVRQREPAGARILGLHLEGPYINPERAGAQNPEHMGPPDMVELERLVAAADGSWRLITLAPELPGALGAIRYLREQGVRVSAGHTASDWETARQALAAGATHLTHTFNAMNGLHHREPGLLGAMLDDDAVWAELIADGLHVHPVMMRLLYKLKGVDKLVLITDAMRAQGCPDGEYTLGDLPVVVKDGEARLRSKVPGEPGALAGSVLTMNGAVRRMVQDVGVSLVEAVRMASYNPAAAIGMQDSKGALAKAYDADVVVLDDDFNVQMTAVEGCIVYRASP